MKAKLLFISLVISNLSLAQIKVEYIDFKKDSLPKIINNISKKPLGIKLDLNGELMESSTMFGLDPAGIESVTRNIKSSNEEIIVVKTKQSYSPNLVSLINLIEQTNLNLDNFIILIDQQIINGKFDKIFVDKNYILQIKAENIQSKDNKTLAFVSIFTKSNKNIDEAKKQIIK